MCVSTGLPPLPSPAMRVVEITRHGGPEVLQVVDRPDPPLPAGHVRIAVAAAGVNFADTMARTGMYPDAPKPPMVVGYEVAGTVAELGDGVDALAAGDRVMAVTQVRRLRVAGRRPGRATRSRSPSG